MFSSKENKKIAVLLSAFNGENFIEEQISSLTNQCCFHYIDIDIHIRDDGSSDETCGIVKNIMTRNSNIFLYEGDNLGVIQSFLWLVENVKNYDYYAFCDQDDVWEPLKLMAAVSKLEVSGNDIPLVYCSAYDYVDKNLSFIGRFQTSSDLSVQNILIENCAPGCTMVFNSKLRDKYCSLDINNLSQRIVMHDWFILLLGVGFGKVLYDYNSYLLYRQHENNVVGKKTGFAKVIQAKIRQFRKECKRSQHLLYLQSELLAECCSDNKTNKLYQMSNKFVTSQGNIISRVKFVFFNNIKRVKVVDDVIFKLLYIFGYYK